MDSEITGADTVRIACVGDVMCGDFFNRIGGGVAWALDKYGADFVPVDVVRILKNHDVVMCNVECVISDVGRDERSLRSLQMRARPQAADYLSQWGMTVAHVANNHILEHGLEAATDTVEQLRRVGILTVGAGRDGDFQSGMEVAEVNLNGIPVCIIGACIHSGKYAFDGGGGCDEVLRLVSEQSGEKKLVFVSLHWGDEYIDRPSLWQRNFARQLTRAGAALVAGHHPHVVQGIEYAGGSLIAYSLGNFIFDMTSEDVNWSVILSITIRGGEVVDWSCIPIIQGKDFRPELVCGARKRHIEEEILRRNKLACMSIENRKDYEREYFAEVAKLEKFQRRLLRRQIARNFFSLKPVYWPQVLFRPIQRRLGWW